MRRFVGVSRRLVGAGGGVFCGKAHLLAIPTLAAPANALFIDDASACAAAANVFGHRQILSPWVSAVGAAVIGHRVIAKRHVWRPQGAVLGDATARALAPHPERAGPQLCPHQPNHRGLAQARAFFNGLERGSVFPGHLDHGRNVARRQAAKAVTGVCVQSRLQSQSESVNVARLTEPAKPSGADAKDMAENSPLLGLATSRWRAHPCQPQVRASSAHCANRAQAPNQT